MCGIAGVLLPARGAVKAEWLRSLDSKLRHRGPDDRGFLGWNGEAAICSPSRDEMVACGSRLAFVHRRLAILDLSPAGWQPMLSEDKRHAIIFNGEVYNYRELRCDLERLGYAFHSNSDTEVVLAAWRQWGIDAFKKFVGMFAVAVLDLDRQSLVLARDQFGIKPLYWAKWEEGIVFASEITALLALPGFSKIASSKSVYDYLAFGYTDRGKDTMLSGCERVPAGCCYEFSLETTQLSSSVRFWDSQIETEYIDENGAIERIRAEFIQSVSLHLRSDVPLGIALSGGIDSTSVLGAINQLGLSQNVKAFSFISEDPGQSEEQWIDLASEHYGIEVHKIRPERGELATDLNQLIRSQGEPFATTGMFAQAKVFQSVKDLGIKVTLDGQGADEMLAGYPTYLVSRIADLLAEGHLGSAVKTASSGKLKALSRAALMLASTDVEQAIREFRMFGGASPWLFRKWFADRGCLISSQTYMARRRDLLHDRLDQTFYDLSLPALLRYADRNSMAYSVESRVPFLTPALVSLIASLPSNLLISKDGLTKSIFRRAMEGLVPDQILSRRDKVGFSVPEALWLRSEPEWLRKSTKRALEKLPMMNGKAVNSELERILAGKSVGDSRLWRCICMSMWADEFSIEFN